jgi:hypothetical protein
MGRTTGQVWHYKFDPATGALARAEATPRPWAQGAVILPRAALFH